MCGGGLFYIELDSHLQNSTMTGRPAKYTEALLLMIMLLPGATPLHSPPNPSFLRRRAVLAGLVSASLTRPARSGGWQDYETAPTGSTTAEIIQSASDKAATLFVEKIPAGPATLPPAEARDAARRCNLECFQKFGDSLIPSTEYDVSVYCASRCFEDVASTAFGLKRGSADFCRAYSAITDLEFYGCG